MRLRYLLILLLIICPVSAIKVAAVDSNKNGVLVDVEAELVPGKGRILMTSEPFTAIDTQVSGKAAVDAALDYTGLELGSRDVIFTFYSDATFVEGGSAGAAMAIETVAILEARRLKKNIVITGGIEADGKMIPVSSILEKMHSAKNDNMFIIPNGQTRIERIVPILKEDDGMMIRADERVVIDLEDYARRHWDLEVKEVGTLEEAMEVVYGFENLTSEREYEVVLDEREMAQEEEVFVRMAEYFLTEANGIIIELPESEEKSNIVESILKSEECLIKGYTYSAANKAFRAVIDARVLMNKNGDIEALKSEIFTRLDGMKIPEGYRSQNHFLVAARERYSWALGEKRIIELTEEPSIERLEMVRAWLDISEELLKEVDDGKKEFSTELARLSEKKTAEAKEEIAADFVLNQDTYASTTLLNAAEYERERGWYYEAGYDSMNAKARAFCIGDQYELEKMAKKHIVEAEEYVLAAEEEELGFWARQYLGEAKISLFENSTRNACAFGMMAKEYAEFDLAVEGYEI
ncbi:S16 family serine protease, partial [Candidatus Undinarchaeota archaeon]